MDLKQKVKAILLTIGGIILFSAGGFLIYFIVNDTLSPPPENGITNNLFIEKNLIDIENLAKTDDMLSCRTAYYNTWNSIHEDYLNYFLDENGFFGNNTQDNANQYQTFWEKLNFAYIERFITLANNYFEQLFWDKNTLVSEIIAEIKQTGFVEYNTRLEDFENSISWYNSVANCISNINKVIYWQEYFRYNNLSNLQSVKNSLASQSCKKNDNKLSELNNAYNNLRDKSEQYLKNKIQQNNQAFNNESDYDSRINKDGNYNKYTNLKNEVNIWNNTFYNNDDLNNELQKFKDNLDRYY